MHYVNELQKARYQVVGLELSIRMHCCGISNLESGRHGSYMPHVHGSIGSLYKESFVHRNSSYTHIFIVTTRLKYFSN